MKVFRCDHCSQLVFFENIQCLRCGHALAYLPDFGFVGSIEKESDGQWRSPLPRARGRTYRLCQNYAKENVCNWAVAAKDSHALCIACRLTRVIPDLSRPENPARWYRLELAKRRLVYTLEMLGLPVLNRQEDPERGLVFEFRADEPGTPILTGHHQGVITVNIVEADDAEREKRRAQFHEPYRTVLGHFRHESGHYYWDRLIQDSPRLVLFREKFGDERQDYAAAIARHYLQGPPADWQQNYISAYASAHPWEDWAETWAHYLHMVDALETASACGLSLQPPHSELPHLDAAKVNGFEDLMANWLSLTYVLNNLNRGLGLPDGYPFVLSDATIDKIHIVHEVVRSSSSRPGFPVS